jgi:glutaredoxin-dependent peroxiredoxin
MNTHPYVRTLPMALAVALLTTAVLQAQAPAPPPPPSIKVGQEAPDFTANYLAPPDANGRRQRKEVKLSDFKGQKNVVLAFFPAAFSSGCTNEMSKYQETTGQFNANNTVIVGISVDSPWANAAFAEKLGAQFTILSDAKRDVSRAYGVFDEQNVVARRTTFVIDRAGIVQQVFMAQEALDPAHALEACAVLKEVK